MRARPTDDARPRELSDGQILARLAPILWPADDWGLRLRILIAMALLTVMAGVSATVPIVFARAVDHFTEDTAAAVAAPVALLMLYGALHWGGKLAGELRWALFGPIEHRVNRRLGGLTLDHLHDLSLRFHLDRRAGQLARVMDNGLKGVRELLFDAVFLILPFLVEVVLVTGVVAVLFDGIFALVMGTTLTLYFAALVVGSAILRKKQRASIAEGARAQGVAIDSLLNHETVKFFGNEAYAHRRYDAALAEVERLGIATLATRSVTGIVNVTIIGVGLVAMVLLAADRVAAGTMTIGGFVLVNGYLMQLLRPLERLGMLYRSIKNELAHAEALVLLLDQIPEIRDAPEAVAVPVTAGTVAFENVGFGYDAARTVLSDVSFTAGPGRTVALVGPTGAGKSTVAKLLFRFYDPTAGRIALDGVDLRHATQASARAVVGVVPQEPVLFNETVAFNIGFGRPAASQTEIEAAAKVAEIHNFIAGLPDGYDTVVGERGLKLSGGEKQRVAIARMVLKAPRVVVLDEATSALDTATEARVQANLRARFPDRAMVIVAHRLSTVTHADEIVVLDGGRVAERGPHAALIGQGGLYAGLWDRQRHAPDAARAVDPAAE